MIVYGVDAVQVVEAPGANVVAGQVNAPALASLIAEPVQGDGAGVGHHDRVGDRVAQVVLPVVVHVHDAAACF